MRRVSLAWYLGSALLLFACGDGNTDGSGCAAGTESCNGSCVAIGNCNLTPTCSEQGLELCNAVCVTPGTCQGNACLTGQIVCNNTCFTGTTCPVVSSTGGQTSIGQTTTRATGGVQSTTPATGGTGNTATGGKTATGGTTAVATTAYVDPNPSACSDTSSGSGTLFAQWAKTNMVTTNNPGKSYTLMANWWSVFNAQTITISGLGFTVQNPNGATTKNNSDPIGYPTLMIGQYQDVQTMGSGLPKLVSSLSTIPVVFNTNVGSIGNSGLNASMDVWFNTSSSPLGATANAPTGGYLMVWQNKPSNYQPRGSITMSDQTVGSVSGKWNVWSDGTCVSYVSTSTQGSLTFDLNDFIKHAVSNGKVIKSNWYLADIFAGFEIWNGGSGAKVSQFCAKVN